MIAAGMHDAAARLGLGRPEQDFAGRSLHERGPDAHGASGQVQIAAPQRGHFAPAQAGERGQQDQGAESAIVVAVGPAVVGHPP